MIIFAVVKGIVLNCVGMNWHRIILDEAHVIKNASSEVARACWMLSATNRLE